MSDRQDILSERSHRLIVTADYSPWLFEYKHSEGVLKCIQYKKSAPKLSPAFDPERPLWRKLCDLLKAPRGIYWLQLQLHNAPMLVGYCPCRAFLIPYPTCVMNLLGTKHEVRLSQSWRTPVLWLTGGVVHRIFMTLTIKTLSSVRVQHGWDIHAAYSEFRYLTGGGGD